MSIEGFNPIGDSSHKQQLDAYARFIQEVEHAIIGQIEIIEGRVPTFSEMRQYGRKEETKTNDNIQIVCIWKQELIVGATMNCKSHKTNIKVLYKTGE